MACLILWGSNMYIFGGAALSFATPRWVHVCRDGRKFQLTGPEGTRRSTRNRQAPQVYLPTTTKEQTARQAAGPLGSVVKLITGLCFAACSITGLSWTLLLFHFWELECGRICGCLVGWQV
jgi:hypothetical protein